MLDPGLIANREMFVALALPEGTEWIYYAASGLFFLISGVVCGYFIWRKGYLQTLDAELEVRRTEDELQNLRHDLSLEDEEISSDPDDQ